MSGRALSLLLLLSLLSSILGYYACIHMDVRDPLIIAITILTAPFVFGYFIGISVGNSVLGRILGFLFTLSLRYEFYEEYLKEAEPGAPAGI